MNRVSVMERDNFMEEHDEKICEDIFKLIDKQLGTLIDKEIISKTSFEELGSFFYDYIISHVKNANCHLINEVIRRISYARDYVNQGDYYKEITRILSFEVLPSSIVDKVRSEFESVFMIKLKEVKLKYKETLENLEKERECVNSNSKKIKDKRGYSFIKDISPEENLLYDLAEKEEKLRTREEMLKYAHHYLEGVINEVCDLENPEAIEKLILEATIKSSKNKSEVSGNEDSPFELYKDYIECFEDDIDRDYAIFFKIKLYLVVEEAKKQILLKLKEGISSEELQKADQKYFAKIPKIDDMHHWKKNNTDEYKACLDGLIVNFKLLEELVKSINESFCLKNRKSILIEAIDLYKKSSYEVFNNIIPIQIEGIFGDYLREVTTFSRFTHIDIYEKKVLRDKIIKLETSGNVIYPEATEYFKFYFNNIVRNKIAHGRYYANKASNSDAIFAKELLLDLCFLVHMLSRKSEIEKMRRFICYYHPFYKKSDNSEDISIFASLYNDIVGRKYIIECDFQEKYRPIQVAYWLINPYYENIYEQLGYKTELIYLRSKLLSGSFWEYVLKKLTEENAKGNGLLHISDECSCVVNGLFRCEINESIKEILIKVNKLLNDVLK